MNDIEISLIVSIVTAMVAVAGFSLSRRKERDEAVKRQAVVDVALKEIQTMLKEMRLDIKEIKETSSEHDTRISKVESKIEEVQKHLYELAKVVRADKGMI